MEGGGGNRESINADLNRNDSYLTMVLWNTVERDAREWGGDDLEQISDRKVTGAQVSWRVVARRGGEVRLDSEDGMVDETDGVRSRLES